MTKACKKNLISFAINLSPQTVKNLFHHLKSVVKTYFGRQWNIFVLFFFFILAESGRGRRSIAETEDGSNSTMAPFVTSDDSGRDHETCWLLDVRSLTNPPESVISSPKTKGSGVPPARVQLVWGFGECFSGQNRTGQGGMRTEWREDRLLSWLKSLTTFSAATH